MIKFVARAALLSLSTLVTAAESDLNNADPRNTKSSAGFGFDQDGEYNLSFGTGFNNIYGDGSYQTQTNMRLEYFDEPEKTRLRGAHFDGRFGGVYLDLTFQDVIDIYNVGYMLPIPIPDTKLILFPSLNYTQAAIDTGEAADFITDARGGAISIGGVDYSSDRIARALERVVLDGDDTSDLATFNMYAMMPWSKKYFSVAQVLTGSSYSGFDMELTSVFALFGRNVMFGDQEVVFTIDATYTETEIQGRRSYGDEYTIGVDFKF